MTTTPSQRSIRERVRAGYVPIRHGRRPPRSRDSRQRPSAAYVLGAVATVVAAVLAWRWTGSLPLTVFSGLLAGYGGQTVGRTSAATVRARALVALGVAGCSVGVLLLASVPWGRSWWTVLAALAAGTLAHTLLAWRLVPALLLGDAMTTTDRQSARREDGTDRHEGAGRCGSRPS
jgi:hypothetical protein